ncbi:MAG: hypothetical protein QXT73_02310 [Candidatus Methanomethylicaceae archaeon]
MKEKTTWADIEYEVINALKFLEGIFEKTIKIYTLMEELRRDIGLYGSDDAFFEKITEQLKVLGKVNQIADPENVPPETALRTMALLLQSQYLLSVVPNKPLRNDLH